MMKRLTILLAAVLSTASAQTEYFYASPIPFTNYGFNIGTGHRYWDSVLARYGVFSSNGSFGGTLSVTGNFTASANLTVSNISNLADTLTVGNPAITGLIRLSDGGGGSVVYTPITGTSTGITVGGTVNGFTLRQGSALSDTTKFPLKTTTITVAANAPLSSSAGAQDLSANRTWTLSADTSTATTGLTTLYQNTLKADKSTTISAGTALSGGGSLASNRTISADTTFVATSTQSGFLAYTDWGTFNAKQPAGNYITALTGDVTATGPGSVAATVVDDSHAHTGATLSAIPIGDVTALQDSLTAKLNRSEMPDSSRIATTWKANTFGPSQTFSGSVTLSSGEGLFWATLQAIYGVSADSNIYVRTAGVDRFTFGRDGSLSLHNSIGTGTGALYAGLASVDSLAARTMTTSGNATFGGSVQVGNGDNFKPLIQPDRTSSAVGYSFLGDGNTGMYHPNTDNELRFAVNGTDALSFSSTGAATFAGDVAVNGANGLTVSKASNYSQVAIVDNQVGGATWYLLAGYPSAGDFTLREGGVADWLKIAKTTGAATFAGDVAVNGGDITTSATTFNLLNATATTLNIGGEATTLSIGAATGTMNLNNATIDLNASGANVTVAGANTKKTLGVNHVNQFDGGTATYAGITTTSTDREFPYWSFADAAANYTYFSLVMPMNWDGGVVNVQVLWYGQNASSTGNVLWGAAGQSTGDADTLNTPIGTEQTWTDANQAPPWALNITAWSPDITLSGTPGGGDFVTIRIRRIATDASDTYNSYAARMVGVRVRYSVNAFSE